MRTKPTFSIQVFFIALSFATVSCTNEKIKVNSIESIFHRLVVRPEQSGTIVTEEGAIQNRVANLSQERLGDIDIDLELDGRYYQRDMFRTDTITICRGSSICPCQSSPNGQVFYFVTPHDNISVSVPNAGGSSSADTSSLGRLFTNMSLFLNSNEVFLNRDTIAINGKSYDRYSINVSDYQNVPLITLMKIYFKLPGSNAEGVKEARFIYDKNKGIHHGLVIKPI